MADRMNTPLTAVNPIDGRELTSTLAESSPAQVDETCRRAAGAAHAWANADRATRAHLLEEIAREIDAAADDLVEVAHAESALPIDRLRGEAQRASGQMRFWAAVIREGGYLDVAVDHARSLPGGRAPDLRRSLRPVGPVAVFAASNFPFAFSVLGGDVAAALAVGCPVVVKAHPSHPETSAMSYSCVQRALDRTHAPEGLFGMVVGMEAGLQLVRSPEIQAVSFTGSQGGARALMEAMRDRPVPIPFYGELASVNPVLVGPAATRSRGAGIAAELVASATTASGQLCTKPGLVLIPDDQHGELLAAEIRRRLTETGPMTVLNGNVQSRYRGAATASEAPGASVTGGDDVDAPGFWVSPRVTEVDLGDITPALLEECFGPSVVVARYPAAAVGGELASQIRSLPGSLATSIYVNQEEMAGLREEIQALASTSGRVAFDAMPTGVAVSWAQTHGGPWPAATTPETSVGAGAGRRFMRPVTWQDAPGSLLPDELRDDASGIPRRVDGVLQATGEGPEVIS